MPENQENAAVQDIEEVISLINKLNDEQKKIVLASLRGAVLIAESET